MPRSKTFSLALLIGCALGVLAQTSEPDHLQRLRAARKSRAKLRREGSRTIAARALAGRKTVPMQTFDSSADSTVSGAYFVRHLLTLTDPNTSAITRAVSLTGTMTFDGKGNYNFSGQELDSTAGTTASSYSISGTYAVSASGLLQLTNPVDNSDTEYGGVGASGQIIASATEGNYDDVLVAIPAGPASALASTYQVGFIDYLQGNASNVRDGFYTLTANGTGSFGNVTVNGSMANQGNTPTSQTLSGVTYSFNGTTGTITFPTASNPAGELVSGPKTFAVSPDGGVIVGGSANGYDLFVGVKSASGVTQATFLGTYFIGALENDVSGSCGESNCIDSFYGAMAANGQGAGTEHLRDVGFDFNVYDYTSDIVYSFPPNGLSSNGSIEWILGANGASTLQVGTGTYYTLIVGFAAKQYSGSGVYINPDGIVNSANFAPITNSTAPGEYVTMVGTGLGTSASAKSLPLPTSLGSAQLNVDGNGAPLLMVSPTVVDALLPNATPVYDLATFQLSVSGANSNQVTLYTASTAPGVFTTTANGIGTASVYHSNYTPVTQASPAVAGETLFFYATGLGATSPVVADGAAAPTSPAAMVTDPNLFVDILDSSGNVNDANITFAALAPGLAGIYQINFVVPSGTASGLGYLELSTTDGYTSEAKINVK